MEQDNITKHQTPRALSPRFMNMIIMMMMMMICRWSSTLEKDCIKILRTGPLMFHHCPGPRSVGLRLKIMTGITVFQSVQQTEIRYVTFQAYVYIVDVVISNNNNNNNMWIYKAHNVSSRLNLRRMRKQCASIQTWIENVQQQYATGDG